MKSIEQETGPIQNLKLNLTMNLDSANSLIYSSF